MVNESVTFYSILEQIICCKPQAIYRWFSKPMRNARISPVVVASVLSEQCCHGKIDLIKFRI